MGVGLCGVRWDVSDFIHITLQSYGFAAVFDLFFDYPNFGGRDALEGRQWYRWV